MFLPASVCLSVGFQNNSKTYGWILTKFSGIVQIGIMNKRLDFQGQRSKVKVTGSKRLKISL